ncbi:MAG: DUF4383 domain-containing protein [Corynebacteriales bacterium]|nr:DUF4383 domain-containing protein [Mycobacteriales bacterium]
MATSIRHHIGPLPQLNSRTQFVYQPAPKPPTKLNKVGHHNVTAGYLLGAFMLLLGGIALPLQHGVQFHGKNGEAILGVLKMNPLLCFTYLGAGTLLVLAAWLGPLPAHIMNTLLGVLLVLIGVLGIFIWTSSANILALSPATNAVHVAIGTALLIVGLRPIRAFND